MVLYQNFPSFIRFCNLHLRFSVPISLFSSYLIHSTRNFSSSGLSSSSHGKVSHFITPFWSTSICRNGVFSNASGFVNLDQSPNFSARAFCCVSSLDILATNDSISYTSSNARDEHLVSASNRVYETIFSNVNSSRSLERTLDSFDIELTTELVNDVIQRLRYEEKLAFRFFTWVGHQEGYTHVPQTYNFMIDILSSTRYKARQFGVVCDILDHMKRRQKNSVPLDALLMILRAYTEKHLTHLRKFAKKKRIKMKTPPEIDAFNLLLDSLCKCSLVREAEIMFHRVKSKLVPNAETYNILFFGWCRIRDPKKAMKVLEEMLEMNHTPENFTYNAAIDSFCTAGMVLEATELFEFMRTKGSTISSPTAKTYSIMIVALAKSDMMDESFKLLADMRSCGCLPDVSTYKDMIEGMCLAGKVEAAYKILEEMSKTGFPPDILTYNCFLKVLCNLKKPEESLGLCDRMISAGCEPSVHTYDMLIAMFFEIGEPDRATNIWHEMDKRGCERTVDTYGIMIIGLFNSERMEDACFLLEEVMDRGLKLPYQKLDAIMLRLSAVGNLRLIHRLSEHMRRFYNVAMARRFAITQKKKGMSLRRK